MGSPAPSSTARPHSALVDVGAHPAQDVDHGTPGRVDTDVADRELGVGVDAPAMSQNAAAETSPGTRSAIAFTATPPCTVQATAPSGMSTRLDRHAPCAEHPFRVIAGRDRLANRRSPLRPKPRQQDRRLHLRTRHGRRVVDRPERGTTDHGQGREGVVPARVERGAHRAQRFDDTSDRAPTQRIVAVERGRHRQSGEDPAAQPRGSSRSCRSRAPRPAGGGRPRPATRSGSRRRPALARDRARPSPRVRPRSRRSSARRHRRRRPRSGSRRRPARPGSAPGG